MPQTHVHTVSGHGEGGIGAIGLMDVLRGMFTRRKKLIVISTLLFAALGYLIIAISSPVYTASSQVIVEYEDTPYTRSGAAGANAAIPQITDRDVRSQVEVIRSRDLALKVLHKLNLIGSAEFDPLKRGIGPLKELKITLGFAADPRKQTPEQRALAVWEKNLKVYNLPNTKVIVIEFNSSSPKTAAAVANALAEAYVEQTRATRLARTNEAREWLKQQIEKLRAKVVQAEKAVETYRAQAGLFQGVQAKLHNQELSELSAQIVRAAAERSQAEAKAKAIRKLLEKGQVEKSADVLRSQLIQRLREQQVQIRRRLAELMTIYLDNHPRVKAVRRELADLKRQINAEAHKIAESLEEQARIAATREAELRARLAKMKAQVSEASQHEVKLRELEREAKAQRSLLESFLARYTDALTREDKQALPGMARVIARAWPPASPSFPKPGPIMLLSVLAGLVLGMGLAFILEVMAAVRQVEQGAADRAMAASVQQPAPAEPSAPVMMAATSTQEQQPQPEAFAAAAALASTAASVVQKPYEAPHEKQEDEPANHAGDAGTVPNNGNAVVDAVVDADAPPPLAVAVARHMRRWHEDENMQRLAIASLGLSPSEAGKTVLEAAREMAKEHRVIVLDTAPARMRLPIGSAQDDGLAELLAGKAGFADVVQFDSKQWQLHMVGAGKGAIGGNLLQGGTMQQLLKALQDNYDVVVLHEGEPRYPLQPDESVLPLAEGVMVMHASDEKDLAGSLQAALMRTGNVHVACIDDQAVPDVAAPALGKDGDKGIEDISPAASV